MLVNPYNETFDETVARASKKTDMYAFGMMCWEAMAQKRPMGDITTEAKLCARVHQGHRPAIDQLPDNTPAEIVSLITDCWDKDRLKRWSAVECLILLTQMDIEYANEKNMFNIFILSDSDFDIRSNVNIHNSITVFKQNLFHFLVNLGAKVCYSTNKISKIGTNSVNKTILIDQAISQLHNNSTNNAMLLYIPSSDSLSSSYIYNTEGEEKISLSENDNLYQSLTDTVLRIFGSDGVFIINYSSEKNQEDKAGDITETEINMSALNCAINKIVNVDIDGKQATTGVENATKTANVFELSLYDTWKSSEAPSDEVSDGPTTSRSNEESSLKKDRKRERKLKSKFEDFQISLKPLIDKLMERRIINTVSS
jgi:hypothetical protein